MKDSPVPQSVENNQESKKELENAFPAEIAVSEVESEVENMFS